MREIRWRCDGCGKSEYAEEKISPTGWTQVRVTVAGLGEHRNIDRLYDLCWNCQEKMAWRSNPKNWGSAEPQFLDVPPENMDFDILISKFAPSLSTRVVRFLEHLEIVSVNDLLRHRKNDFLREPNFGRKSMQEIEEVILSPLNLHMKP